MFERFTDRARKVMALANQEAQRFNHEYIGTEHILLGLLREHDGVAAQVLRNLGLKLEEVREEVLNLLGASNEGGEGEGGTAGAMGAGAGGAAGGATTERAKTKSKTPALDSF